MISRPGSEAWKDAQVATLLEERLQEAHQLYLDYIDGIKQDMEEINEHLEMDSAPIQEMLNSKVSWEIIRHRRGSTLQE